MSNPVPAGPDLQTLLHAASLAPSSHNTQPWRFRAGACQLELLADRSRALPVNDPDGRELVISCGCALFNLRVAAAAAGWQAEIEPLPEGAGADLLARVRLLPASAVLPLARLQAAIADRRTWRERFVAAPVGAPVLAALAAAAAAESAELVVLAGAEQRLAAAALVAEGDALLWGDPAWRGELAEWMHPRRRGDGLTLPALAVPVAQAVVRSFDMGRGQAAKDRQLADESPVLALLCTAADGPRDWLAAGQALQHLLLLAVQQGLQASYLNQPVQLPALRPRLQALAGRPGHAQLLLRLGQVAKVLPATPRRPVSAIQADD